MSATLDTLRGRYDRLTVPTVWVAFALSLLLHAFLIWGWRQQHLNLPFEDLREGAKSGSLSVRLAQPPSPPAALPPAPAHRPEPPPARAHARSAPAPRKPAARQKLAVATPSPSVTALPAPEPAPAPPAPKADAPKPPAFTDLAAYMEARRRARGAAPLQDVPPAETEQERHNRVVAANLGLDRTPEFGADRQPGGGIFQISRLNYLDAEFLFFGWNKDIRRNSRQLIEVRKGDNASIELAVVRRMIAIIRDHSGGDFEWESPRLRRIVTLSARPEDNADLETFMMREFFPAAR